jgi:hypothetical protein
MHFYTSFRIISDARRHEDLLGSGGIISPFLTSALDRGKLLPSSHVRFTPGEIVPSHRR